MVKIFVGNLSQDVVSDDLGELFAEFGEVEDCEKLPHKQFGFVHMVDEKAAKKAVIKLSKTFFKGTRITVEVSASKMQKLFVGNIGYRTTQEELREHFETAGANIVQVENCENKKFGFVRIEISKGYGEVNKLVKNLNGSFLNGNRISVELSEDKTLEEKRRLRKEREMMGGYEPSSWELNSYKSYPRPSQGWGSSSSANCLHDFIADGWSPGKQSAHVNKIKGFSSENYGYSRNHPCSGNIYSRDAQSSPQPNVVQNKEDPCQAAELLQHKLRNRMFCQSGLSNLELLQTGELADYRLECEGTAYQVHKIILGSRSPVFRRIVKTEPVAMLVSDLDSLTLRMLLHFIYTGTVEVKDISPVSIMKLVGAADLYQVGFLKEGLQASLADNISVDTAVDYLIYSEELQLSELKKVVNMFICRNAKVMKERSDFKNKLSQYPHLILDLFSAASR